MGSALGRVSSRRPTALLRTCAPSLVAFGVAALTGAILLLAIGSGTGSAAANARPARVRETGLVTTTLDGPAVPDWVAELLRGGRVSAAADPVLIRKTVSDPNPYLGERITYTIYLTNSSAVTIADIVLYDALPVPVDTDSVICDGCIKTGRGLTYTQGAGTVGAALGLGSPPPPASSPLAPSHAPTPTEASVATIDARAGDSPPGPSAEGLTAGSIELQSEPLIVDAPPGSAGPSTSEAAQGIVSAAGAITASFTAAPRIGERPLTVVFTNLSTPAQVITSSLWTFGDGTSEAPATPLASVTHQYASAGSYTVTLAVSGGGETSIATATGYITVTCIPVQASFDAQPLSGPAPLTVWFHNTSTGDYDSVQWDFGDGATSAQENPTHTYTLAGTYTVELAVSGCGGTDAQTRVGYITVCTPAQADFTGSPVTGAAPLTVTFTNASSGDYESLLWTFSDGYTSTAASPAHTFSAPGSYNVFLTVSGCGGTDTVTRTSYITAYAPVRANFGALPTIGLAPLTVVFTNTSTGDFGASLWDFGNGVTSTDRAPVYTYTDPGIYDVMLTVSGPGGADTMARSAYIGVYPTHVTAWTVEQLMWSPGISLGPGEAMSVTFSMPVVGQADGAVLRNQAFVQYTTEGGETRAVASPAIDVTVRVRVDEGLPAQPSWVMPPIGVMNAQAWEDMDGDGDLDLAVTGANGPVVYRNAGGGRLQFCWADSEHSSLDQEVLWADLDGDGGPELVVAGAGLAVYLYDPQGDFTLRQALASPDWWVRRLTSVAAVDADQDGDLDLLASCELDARYYASAPKCPVVWYQNDGTGTLAAARCVGGDWCPQLDSGYVIGRRVAAVDWDNGGDANLALALDVHEIRQTCYHWCWWERHCEHTCNLFECWPYFCCDRCWWDFHCVQICEPYWYDEAWTSMGRLTPGAGDAAPTWSGNFTIVGPKQDGDGPYTYGFAWGDYDRNGYLDPAVVYALPMLPGGSYRIYGNEAAYTEEFPQTYSGSGMGRALDWGDMNGDGWLELVMADAPPHLVGWSPGSSSMEDLPNPWASSDFGGIIEPGDTVLSMRWVDYDNDGDLDLALTSNRLAAAVFANFSPFLSPSPMFADGWASNSVAWGDADQDGDLDLLSGAGAGTLGARLYSNANGRLEAARYTALTSSNIGPHDVAWGDYNRDGKLEAAVTQEAGWHTLLYTSTIVDRGPAWDVEMDSSGLAVAWGYRSWVPGGLDLLVGGSDGAFLYSYDRQAGTLSQEPVQVITGSADSLSWGDYDGDGLLDIAVAVNDRPQVRRNLGDGSFQPIAFDTSVFTGGMRASAVAWADYDGDGRQELAVGCNPGPLLVYKYDQQTSTFIVDWQSDDSLSTTSLAWGDWDSDGDPDLAVGNYGQRDEVYLNLSRQHGSAPLVRLWQSADSLQTTDVAWGDMDGDGDLDLAVASRTGSRVYENNYSRPSHLTDRFASTMPLQNNPSYLSIKRPGSTAAAYLRSSAEILPRYVTEPVAIHYTLYDPDGTRDETVPNAPGDRILDTTYEYSLDGGSTWKHATAHASWAGQAYTTTRLGRAATFLWDAVADKAISDDARFRITVVNGSGSGPKQRATTSAVSPPFRVRGTTCLWPEYPSISPSPANPRPGQAVEFTGLVERASGVLTFSWDFGDGTPVVSSSVARPSISLGGAQGLLAADLVYGQVIEHTYAAEGTYAVTMTVQSEPCPAARTVTASITLQVGGGPRQYLPLVMK